jgi:mRNA-degrading endonuclease RelE of RelBE toxin-antitoxin system
MFAIEYAPSVARSGAARAYDRRLVLDRIDRDLKEQPTHETRNRKLLLGIHTDWANTESIWQLRVGEIRVFYDVDHARQRVLIRAIRRMPPHKTTEDIV